MQNKFLLVVLVLAFGLMKAQAANDPTRPPGQSSYQGPSEEGVKKLILQGLVFGKNSWVVVNDLAIQEGEIIKGIKVIKVNKDKVLVRHRGEKYWLKWKHTAIKKNIKQSL